MRPEDINDEIEKIDRELQQKEARRAYLETLRKYKGDDRVVSAQEMEKEINEEKKEEKMKMMTKIHGLDTIIGGFREGQLVIISASTGSGKTTLAQTFITNFSKQDIPCLFFSYEVGNEEIFEKFPELPVFYLPRKTKQNNMKWLEDKMMESIAKFDTKVVFIDHLHFLLEMGKMAQATNLSLLIGMMMRELKTFAIENNILIFLISHLKKSTLERGAMPTIDDLRDSSFVAQESDIVLLMKRDEEADPNNARNKIPCDSVLLIVSKNRRTGKLGSVKLTYRDKMLTETYDGASAYSSDKAGGHHTVEEVPESVSTNLSSIFD